MTSATATEDLRKLREEAKPYQSENASPKLTSNLQVMVGQVSELVSEAYISVRLFSHAIPPIILLDWQG
jgi:hypothetical protein